LGGTMLGNVGRHRRWPWAILFLLFALTFVWSFAVMGDQVGDVWSILQIGSAVGAGIALLFLVLTSISSRRRRRGQREEGSETGADEQQPDEEPPTTPTYEEVFGVELGLDEERLPDATEDEDKEWTGEEDAQLEAEAQGWAEQLPAEEHAPTSEEDGQALEADLDEADDRVEALEADGDPEDNLRRMREEFKARAEEAALRVKQREAELHEAGSASDPKR
jgi:hypothetical protein